MFPNEWCRGDLKNKRFKKKRRTCVFINKTGLRLPYIITSAVFFKLGFLGQNSGRRVIFNFWKKLKKTKYWRGKGGFYVFPGSNVLIWQPYGVFVIKETSARRRSKACHSFLPLPRGEERVTSLKPALEAKTSRELHNIRMSQIGFPVIWKHLNGFRLQKSL